MLGRSTWSLLYAVDVDADSWSLTRDWIQRKRSGDPRTSGGSEASARPEIYWHFIGTDA